MALYHSPYDKKVRAERPSGSHIIFFLFSFDLTGVPLTPSSLRLSHGTQDMAFSSAANILLRSNRVPDAVLFAKLALLTSPPDRGGVHLTLANALAADGKLDAAAKHYEASIRLRPHYDIVINLLRQLR
jgi:predicted Zn-dependent protease